MVLSDKFAGRCRADRLPAEFVIRADQQRNGGHESVTGTDSDFLATLLGRYHAETGSAVAAGLLADWPAALSRLCRVVPRDYKRVLAATSRARREGQDLAAAVMAAARG